MATIDTSIYGNLLRPVKSVQEYQTDMDQADTARTQNLLGRTVLAEKQAAADRAAGLRSLAGRWGADTTDEQRVSDLKNSGYFDQADSLVKTSLERDKTRAAISKDAADAAAKANEQKLKQYTYIAQTLAGVRDQAGYDQALQLGQLLGFDTSKIPPQYNPQFVEAARGSLITEANRLAAQKQQQETANDVMIPDGKGGYMPNQPLISAKQSISKAGASNVNVKVDAKLGEGVAKEVGPMFKESYDKALAAQDQMNTADRLISAIDAGGVMAGPGATFRLRAAQIGDTLGITGKDTAEKIANTRAAIQAMAQATLSARSAFKGQGAVTDYESKLAERVASGQIDDLTPAEIKQVAMTGKRLAGMVITQHQNKVNKMRKYDSLAPMSELFDIPSTEAGGGAPSAQPSANPGARPPLASFGK